MQTHNSYVYTVICYLRLLFAPAQALLMGVEHYDIIRGTSIDYMHCALQGIMELLMSLV